MMFNSSVSIPCMRYQLDTYRIFPVLGVVLFATAKSTFLKMSQKLHRIASSESKEARASESCYQLSVLFVCQ
jgi:hypothetical protein